MRPSHRARSHRRIGPASVTLAVVAGLVALTGGDSPAARDAPASDPVESASVDRRDVVADAVPSANVARAARSQSPVRRPRSVRLPSGVSMPVDVASTGQDGVLDLPSDVDRAGWWDGGARIGDPFGTMVLAAHVDSVTQGLGPFAELLDARRGRRLHVQAGASSQAFEIVSVRLTPRESLSDDGSTFSVDGPPRLVLITCAGPFDPDRGGYRDNLVIVAHPVGAAH